MNKLPETSYKNSGHCKCGEPITDYHAFEMQDEWGYYPFTCKACGKEGKENYSLTYDDSTIN